MSYEKLVYDDGDEETEFDKEHAQLFTFIGEGAVHDHVFLLYEPEGGEDPTARWLWKINPQTLILDPDYVDAYEHMMVNDYPAALNAFRVSEQDKRIFNWQFGIEEFHREDVFPEWMLDETS